MRTNGPAEAQRLDAVVAGLRDALGLLQQPHALKNVRVLIREHRAAAKARLKLRIPFPY
jgi:hypothetical protein